MGYIVTVRFEVLNQNFDGFIELLLAYAGRCLGEFHCQQFDVCASEDKSIFLYEVYTNAEAFQEHLRTAHYNEFDMRSKSFVENKQVKFFQRIR